MARITLKTPKILLPGKKFPQTIEKTNDTLMKVTKAFRNITKFLTNYTNYWQWAKPLAEKTKILSGISIAFQVPKLYEPVYKAYGKTNCGERIKAVWDAVFISCKIAQSFSYAVRGLKAFNIIPNSALGFTDQLMKICWPVLFVDLYNDTAVKYPQFKEFYDRTIEKIEEGQAETFFNENRPLFKKHFNIGKKVSAENETELLKGLKSRVETKLWHERISLVIKCVQRIVLPLLIFEMANMPIIALAALSATAGLATLCTSKILLGKDPFSKVLPPITNLQEIQICY